jgi:outer membrane immunogenic protein
MKKLLLGTLTWAALTGAAFAADMPVRPAAAPAYSNWNGWYVGINAGGGFQSQDATLTSSRGPGGVFFATFGATSFGAPLWVTGPLGGFQVGWNWQAGWWLAGIEADIDCANITGNAQFTFPTPFFQVGVTNTLDRLGTVRGRLGVLAGPTSNFLLYGTGGLAYGRNTLLIAAMGTGTGAVVNTANQDVATKTGWTAGGGIEWNFLANWTVKAEYLFVDLGSQIVTTNATTTGFGFDAVTVDNRDRYHILRIGVNYIFGGLGKGVVAAY